MQVDELFDEIRGAADERVWGAAVQLARSGAVRGVSNDGTEIALEVKAPGRAVPHEVYLWPADTDWGCDCELPGKVCVHVVAAAIALREQGKGDESSLPKPKKEFRVALRYDLTTDGHDLRVRRTVVWPDGRTAPLSGPLASANLHATRADAQAEGVLAMHGTGALDAELLRRLLVFLAGHPSVMLDGEPVRVSADPIMFRVRVTDAADGFKVGLYRPSGIDKLYRGAALADGVLHQTSHGDLTSEQRKALLKGVIYGADEVGVLVTEVLPKLEERIPVDIETQRLPRPDSLRPRVSISLREKPGGLEVEARIVYGDPPVARITPGGMLERLDADVVPARDLPAERLLQRTFESRIGLPVGIRRVLPPDQAVDFVKVKLPLHDGLVDGHVEASRYRVFAVSLAPSLKVEQAQVTESRAGWSFDVAFEVEGRHASPDVVLDAWRSGRSLVPLLEGGFAPLPADWLDEHGPLLRELLEARDANGRVDRNATAALVELLEGTEEVVPPDLSRLRSFLVGDDGMPDVPPPALLEAELRPYQLTGYRWLRFLRDMDLHGVLADDMGLGKTVQALAAVLDAGGQALVIAPTSVLRNWEREANRFAPSLSVNFYHGTGRRLDDSRLILTSYALLRLDLELLREREFQYVILDEAQAIKNPTSQTARSATKLRAHNRLCLTGTPVENRLEELWSLFHFLMPGLLGSLGAFRDRFARPIESGDQTAAAALRARVRPYVLRRLKQQVATELPALTEMVIRCELSAEQRRLYDTVRLTAREDVMKAIEARGEGGATMQVLEALLRMRQVCCDPRLLPGGIGEGVPSAKLDALDELLVETVVDNHKALIFSQWTSLLDRVEERLEALGIPWVRLDGSTRDRQTVIDTFQSDDGPPIFLLSLKAGGTGLNLTAADYVLHLDPWWNPAVQQQATDRAHRIGQDKPVVSVKLIAEGTVEERILELQESKRALADAALGTEGGFLNVLSADELRSLFEGA